MPAERLNAQEEKFAFLLSRGIPVQDAWMQAGYAESGKGNNSYATARKPKIRARIAEMQMKANFEEHEVNEAYVRSNLVEIVEKALQHRKIRQATPKGEETYGKFDASAAKQALELLGKTMSMFKAEEVGAIASGEMSLEERLKRYAVEAQQGEAPDDAPERPALSVVNGDDG